MMEMEMEMEMEVEVMEMEMGHGVGGGGEMEIELMGMETFVALQLLFVYISLFPLIPSPSPCQNEYSLMLDRRRITYSLSKLYNYRRIRLDIHKALLNICAHKYTYCTTA